MAPIRDSFMLGQLGHPVAVKRIARERLRNVLLKSALRSPICDTVIVAVVFPSFPLSVRTVSRTSPVLFSSSMFASAERLIVYVFSCEYVVLSERSVESVAAQELTVSHSASVVTSKPTLDRRLIEKSVASPLIDTDWLAIEKPGVGSCTTKYWVVTPASSILMLPTLS